MQKVIQRTERAKRVATRRWQKQHDHHLNAESWERNQHQQRKTRAANTSIREARKNRHVDWEAGSLAPRRDVGDQAITYGSMSIYELQMRDKDPEQRLKWFHITEGDRVVVTKGRERGKIATVQEVNKEKNSVQLKEVNMVDVSIPDWIQREQEDNRKVVATAQQMPIEHVKLVYPLPDPETGVPRDVIIDRLTHINRIYDKDEREWTEGDRVILGTNTIIPWPGRAEPEYEDNDEDTLRITVEEQTFRPFLLHPPMPMSVIDELRNKYSRFRTRHDWEYVQKKEAEDEKMERRKGLGKTMRTPLQELAELRQTQKKAKERELTDEQLARIGEVIAQEKQRMENAVKQLEA